MSDNPDNLPKAFQHIWEHSWVVTFLAATWGVVLRALIGRYQKQAVDHQNLLQNIQNTLQDIDNRLSYIEGKVNGKARRV